MSDFSVSFKNLKSSIPKVLKFLYESGVEVECSWNEEFLKELRSNSLEIEPIWLTTIGLGNMNTPQNFNTTRVPTSDFRSYCGVEWLDKDGKITLENALNFLKIQMKLRGIEEYNGVIELTDWLKCMLRESRDRVKREELCILAERLFE